MGRRNYQTSAALMAVAPQVALPLEAAKAGVVVVQRALKPWPVRLFIGLIGGMFVGGAIGAVAGLTSRERHAQPTLHTRPKRPQNQKMMVSLV